RDLIVDGREDGVLLQLGEVGGAECFPVRPGALAPARARVTADDRGPHWFTDRSPSYAPLTPQPASTVSTSPVTWRASSLSRKSAARATSSASMKPSASGCLLSVYCIISGLSCARALIGVRTRAGAMTLTRILCGA